MTIDKKQQDKFKSVKQRLSTIQLAIKKDLKNSQLPQVDDVEQFTATSDEMDSLCPNELRTPMDDYMDRLGQFQTVMKGRDLQAIEDAFQGLLDCKVSCHKEFRQK